MDNEKQELEVSGQDNAELAAFMEKGLDAAFAKDKTVMSLTAEYFELEVGKKVKLVYVMNSSYDKTDKNSGEIKKINTVVLLNNKKQTFMAAQTAIVNALNNAPKFSTVLITRLKDKPVGGGQTMHMFNVELLH